MKQTRIVSDNEVHLEHNNVIESFKKDFLFIKSKGFVPSNRIHNTGIGKTFEDLIGVEENNNLLVDYKGVLELKATRASSISMVTLFTKAPTYPKGVNTYIRETFGTSDPKSNQKIIHTTVDALKFNSYKNKYGFKLEVSEEKEKIFIVIKNLEDDKIISTNIYYTFEVLRKIIETKCKYIAYIKAEKRQNNEIEEFKFSNATILSGLTFDKFIFYLKRGHIYYDIRIGVNKTGRYIGTTHDHGSGFRIKKNDINKVFKMELL